MRTNGKPPKDFWGELFLFLNGNQRQRHSLLSLWTLKPEYDGWNWNCHLEPWKDSTRKTVEDGRPERLRMASQ